MNRSNERTVTAQQITAVIEANPSVDFQGLNLLREDRRAEMTWNDLEPAEQVETLRAFQRLMRTGADPESAERLIDAGFHSAHQIARIPPKRFVREAVASTGIDRDSAERIHRNAVAIQNKAYQVWATVNGTVASPAYRGSRFSNVGMALGQQFEDLPSYEDLFGTLDYCSCAECRSIFGAAAYLVDLQRIILDYITTPNQGTIPAGLGFAERRPDIGELELTCSNTNTLVPYLQIVNERLIAYLQLALSLSSPDGVLQAIATSIVYPRKLPFNTPLNQIQVLLAQVGAPYGAILAAWGSPATTFVPRSLGLSPDSQTILTSAALTADQVAAYYGIPAADLSTLADPDVFNAVTGIDFPELLDLVQEDLSQAEITAGLQANFFINAGQSAGTVVQLHQDQTTKIWTIQNLTVPALDAINRQFRLSEALAISYIQVDWWLRAAQSGETPVLENDSEALVAVGAMQKVQSAFKLSWLEAAALFGPIKTYGKGDSAFGSQFDCLFNTPDLVAGSGAYHPSGNPLNSTYVDAPLKWTPGSTDPAEVAAIVRVLSGLSLSLTDANLLGAALFGEAELELTVSNLSALYRHARMASAIRVPMSRYLLLLRLAGIPIADAFTATSLTKLGVAMEWTSASGVTVYDLEYVVNNVATVYVSVPYRPDTVPEWHATLVQQVPDSSDAAVPITAQIADLFGVQATQIAPILDMALANVPLPSGVLTWEAAFLAVDAQGNPQYPAYVADVLNQCSRWLVAQRSLSLSDATVANVALFPAAYGLDQNFTATVDSLRMTWNVQALINRVGDTQNRLLVYIGESIEGVALDVRLATLQQATGWSPPQSRQLIEGPVKDVGPLAAQLTAMDGIFALMASLGADAALMGSIAALANATASTSWSAYKETAQSVLSAVQSRYGETWATVDRTLYGQTLVALRDALLGLVVSELHKKYADITNSTGVYEYLLIDVDMGPETQVSYVKEALNACQLYLQRSRLQLETGVIDVEIPPAYWEWMMNYRVWEANRSVFLYPENYLVPTLRTHPTPPFRTLQDNLLQSEVTTEYVSEVFNDYMGAFTDAANLIPVESFRAEVNDAQMGKVGCTFVFGKSNTDPVTFYWASQVDDMPWTAWEKIDVSINASTISAVYAFGRLFAFWLDVTTGSGSSIEDSGGVSVSQSSYNVKVSINYTFQNANRKWVQPQSLVSEELVYYVASGNKNVPLSEEPIFQGLFDFARTMWREPAVLHVSERNFPKAPETQTAEKICVFYGPLLQDLARKITPDPAPAKTDVYAYTFYQELKQAVLNHNQTVIGELSGYQTLRPAIVINGMLEDSILFHEREYMLLDSVFNPPPRNQVNAQLSGLENSLLLVSTPTPVTDNLITDPNVAITATSTTATLNRSSFVTNSITPTTSGNVFDALKSATIIDGNNQVDPEKLATVNLVSALASVINISVFSASQFMDVQKTLFASVAGTPMFKNVPPTTTRVETVKNQPGSYVLYSGQEVFLLTPRQDTAALPAPIFTPLDKSATIAVPAITEIAFVMDVMISGTVWIIESALSKSIYTALVSYGLINAEGVFNTSTPYSSFQLVLKPFVDEKKISEAQVQAIFNICLDAPLVTKEIFASDAIGIDEQTSIEIYSALASYSLIDVISRVSPNLLTPSQVNMALSNLLQNGTVKPNTVPSIYQILNEATIPVSITYGNEGDVSHFPTPAQFTFHVTRLTTAAVGKLDQALFAGSVADLLSTKMQGYPVNPILPFSYMAPQSNVVPPRALDGTQVDFDGLYGEYFWELFFHTPRLVAYMLQGNQKYQDALTWLQCIFNPTIREEFVTAEVIAAETGGKINLLTAEEVVASLKTHDIGDPAAPILSPIGRVNPALTPSTDLSFLTQSPVNLSNSQVLMVQAILLNYELSAPSSHYWRFFPFRTYNQESLQWMLSDENPAMRIYNNDPFDPYAIARLRIGAFEKATVMQYLDVLIAWGDMLFTVDTWETITAASLLYVYASNLLGPRPVEVGECPGADVVVNFNDIVAAYGGDVPQFLIDLEHLVPGGGAPVPIIGHAFNDLNVLFCVPENQQLMAYWDVVADRMYKIGHSMNIDGEVRTLALFEPPLNPLDLVRAAAAGNNVQRSLSPGTPAVPPYRFTSAVAFAYRVVDSLTAFGAALLSALEKQDAEGLSLLQVNQAGAVLDIAILMKEQAISAAQANLTSLQSALSSAQYRQVYYSSLLVANLLPEEQTSLDEMSSALTFNIISGALSVAASIGFAVPQFGSPFAMTYGGQQIGSVIQAASQGMQIGATVHSYNAERASTMAGYARRIQDWTLQQQLATYDVQQILASIEGAQDQLVQAQQDLASTKLQFQQNTAVENYLTKKFTSQQLYSWMAARLSSIYFQAYQVATQAVRAAESSYQFETLTGTSFIAYQYWNSLYKGLLAGEGLRNSLAQMESAYRTQDTRRLSVVKVVSLALTAPEALLDLKTTGVCTFGLDEALYDYDYPGQYARKVVSVSVSIPAVIGPYQTVKAILTQTSNQIVTEPSIEVVDYLLGLSTDPPESGLRTDWMNNQSIAISQAVDDSGMFVLNFGDERYLPFENTGAVSNWKLEMPKTTNRFDFNQLSDVILTIRYTSLSDGVLRGEVEKSLAQVPYQGGLYIDALRQQPSAWNAFMINHANSATQTLQMAVRIAQLGIYKAMTVSQVLVRLQLGKNVSIAAGATFLTITAGTQAPQTPPITAATATLSDLSWPAATVEGPWDFAFDLANADIAPLLTNGFIDPLKLLDIELIVIYEAEIF